VPSDAALMRVVERTAHADDESAPALAAEESSANADVLRPALAESIARHALVLDAARPDAIAKRHRLGLRMARENVDDLCDPADRKNIRQM